MSDPKHPTIYDIYLDKRRLVTQDDVDRWADLEQTYGRMVVFLRKTHKKLVERCKRKSDDA